MKRVCSHCQRPFLPQDLAREESKGMEQERKTYGLRGLRFRFYRCAACEGADIFLDVHRLRGESTDELRQRHAALEATARRLHGHRAEVVVMQR
jgi:hypothetical protein